MSRRIAGLRVVLASALALSCSSGKEDPDGMGLPASTGNPTASTTTPSQTSTAPQLSMTTTGAPTSAPTASMTGTASNTGTTSMPTQSAMPTTPGSGTATVPEPTVTAPMQSTVVPSASTTTPAASATASGEGGAGAEMGPVPSAPVGSNSGGAGGADTMPPTGGLGCTGNELLCEDFESTAVGAVPGGVWHALDDSCQYQMMTFTMGVTDEQKNGGSQSLKITNKHFAQCRLSGAFQAADDFWVRTYEYWDGLDLSNRETLAVDMTPGYRTADDPAVRFGNRSKAPCEEYAGPQVTIIGLVGGEYTGCGSRTLPQGEWYCFEAHVQQATNLTIQTYINGEAISYQSTGKPETDSIGTEAALTEKLDNIRLGIFSTGEATGNVYIDDVAVSTTRIGCAP